MSPEVYEDTRVSPSGSVDTYAPFEVPIDTNSDEVVFDWSPQPTPPEDGSTYLEAVSPPDWLANALKALHVCAAVGPDWNGYGAEPPNAVSLQVVRKLLMDLASTDGPSRIVAMADGGVALYFFSGEALPGGAHTLCASLECSNDGGIVLIMENRGTGALEVSEVNRLFPAPMIADLLSFIGS